MFKKFIGYFFLVLICVFAISCTQGDAQSSAISEISINHVANVRAGDFAPGQLEAHYQKHGYEFRNITQEQYLEGARALLNTGKDVLEKTRTNGDILHYRVSTGEFAVMTSQGRIRTYFKTDYRYWMKQ
jgi:pyocin large subunit-like protein